MMGWQEEAVERLTALTDCGENLPDYGTSKGIGYFVEWHTSAARAVDGKAGAKSLL
jgi:hypothetical protein